MSLTVAEADGRAARSLLARARAGDGEALDRLYREHVADALRLARLLVGAERAEQAEELVADAFARVLAQLRAGRGPTDSFRAYLHVTIRNGHRDALRATTVAPVSDRPWLLDEAAPSAEELVEGFDESLGIDALATLPERWQQVLWHVEVEQRRPAEVAAILGLRPGAVSSLAHRARDGLKKAYLDLHAGPEPQAADCRWAHARMAPAARGELGQRAAARFDAHVAACSSCGLARATVDDVNRRLAGFVLPATLLLAVPASGKGLGWLAAGTASGTAGAAGAAGAVGTSGIAAVVGAAAAAVAGVVAVGALSVDGAGDRDGGGPERSPGPHRSLTVPADESVGRSHDERRTPRQVADRPGPDRPGPDRSAPHRRPSPAEVPSAGLPLAVPTDVPVEVPTELPADLPADVPTGLPADVPAQLGGDGPDGLPSDLPSDLPADVPADLLEGLPH